MHMQHHFEMDATPLFTLSTNKDFKDFFLLVWKYTMDNGIIISCIPTRIIQFIVMVHLTFGEGGFGVVAKLLRFMKEGYRIFAVFV